MDPEIKAMSEISAALGQLEPEGVRRVLKWATERFQIKPSAVAGVGQTKETPTGAPQTFEEFHELFDAANPVTGMDRALVACYWFQVVLAHEDIDSFQLNKELKHLGHASANITRDLDRLMERSPRLVMQVRKTGTSKQARKRYRLTREGIRAVERMLSNGQGVGAEGRENGEN
jgi:hypothetical protein